MQQHRDIAQVMDVGAAQPRHQPIARETQDADADTYQGRQNDAEHRYLQRVEDAHQHGPAIGRGRRIGNQAFADLEAGFPIKETIAGRDLAVSEVDDGVMGQISAQQEDQPKRQHFPEQALKIAILGKDRSGETACGEQPKQHLHRQVADDVARQQRQQDRCGPEATGGKRAAGALPWRGAGRYRVGNGSHSLPA
jgi:hypothetical protein